MFSYILIYCVLCISIVTSSPCHEGTENLYEHCLMHYTDMALWCDRMNLTEIPDPNHIRSPAPCESALAIYGNDSCITTITPVLFRRYSLVKLLDFSHNRIDKVEADNFENANHLRELDLSYNRIDTAEYKFGKIPRLQSLNLAGNRLRHVGPIQYCKDCALRHLTLHDNVISLVKKNSFDGMNQLTSIDLRNNQLTQLSRSLFKTLCKLETLLLSGNNLHTPQPEWFATIAMNGKEQPIYEVDISNNQFRCDCQAYRYWEFLQVLHEDENDSVRNLGNSVDFVCDSGQSFSSLTESEVISNGNCSGVNFTSRSNMTSLSSFSPFKCEVIKPREVEGRRRAEEPEPELTTISHSETDFMTREIENSYEVSNVEIVIIVILILVLVAFVGAGILVVKKATKQRREKVRQEENVELFKGEKEKKKEAELIKV